MLDFSHIPTGWASSDIQVYTGMGTAAGECWQTWQKPRGKKMVTFILVGKGGNGGTGNIGANSAAAGGGGGGSGGQTIVTMPLFGLPDTIYLTLAGMSSTGTLASYICVAPKLTAGAGAPVANDVIAIANGGGNGGNGVASGGGAGAAGGVATAATMPLGFGFAKSILAGQGGIAGGSAVAGANLTLPATGLMVTGGTGGGGLPAAAATGTNGGQITGAGVFPTILGGQGSATATNPADNGRAGIRPVPNLFYGMGGTGGASTHGTATGGGLVQASGGDGAPGCGGGGMAGALTGSAAGRIGFGGPAFCIIVVW